MRDGEQNRIIAVGPSGGRQVRTRPQSPGFFSAFDSRDASEMALTSTSTTRDFALAD